MRKSPAFVTAISIALTIALLTGAGRVLAARERSYPLSGEDAETVYISSGRTIRTLVRPYVTLAADLYWIRAIQYYGGTKRYLSDQGVVPGRRPARDYHELYSLLDIATTLDPRFNIAYRFGAVFLAEAYPAGAGRPDLAIDLLEKGLRERPDRWEYLEDIGFVHYWYRHDFRAAAAAFERAADVPGAPEWLKPLAATTLAQGGDRQSSRVMWEAIRQSADNDWLRNTAEHRLAQLRALDDVDLLQKVVTRYAADHGAPTEWGPIVRANHWRGVPLDPAGVPYVLEPNGRVWVAPQSPLWPLPEEPGPSPAVEPK